MSPGNRAAWMACGDIDDDVRCPTCGWRGAPSVAEWLLIAIGLGFLIAAHIVDDLTERAHTTGLRIVPVQVVCR